MQGASLEYNAKNLRKFMQAYFSGWENNMRFRQAACYAFLDLPEEIQDKIFYADDQKYVGEVLWNGIFE